MRMGRTKVCVALFIPILVMMGWTIYHARVVATGEKIRLKVEGYDPRDMFAGHYLRYRVNYQKKDLCQTRKYESTCLCLDALPHETATANWAGNCAERPDCRLWLKGRCDWNGFTAEIERYYISEKRSGSLAQIPPDAEIEVTLDGQGRGIVTGFFIGGKPLSKFFSEQK